MIKILFVCHGNICRSPMAEFIMKDIVKKQGIESKFYIESAATSTEEIWNGVGNPVYPPAREELKKHGITCEGKRARQMTAADYDRFDYIIGMDRMNLRNMLRIAGGDGESKLSLLLDYTACPGDVADPWYTGDFVRTYEDITAGLAGFLKYLREHEERKISSEAAKIQENMPKLSQIMVDIAQ